MTNAAAWAMIVGFISSLFIIPLIQQPDWSSQRRSIVTLIYCVVAGLGTVFFAGDFKVLDITSAILAVFVTAIGTYKGLADKLPLTRAIEEKTAIRRE